MKKRHKLTLSIIVFLGIVGGSIVYFSDDLIRIFLFGYDNYALTKQAEKNFMKNINAAIDSGKKEIKAKDLIGLENIEIDEVCFRYIEFDYETNKKIETESWKINFSLKAPLSNLGGSLIIIRIDKSILDLVVVDDSMADYCYEPDALFFITRINKAVLTLGQEFRK